MCSSGAGGRTASTVIVGAGQVGQALARGLAAADLVPARQMSAFDIGAASHVILAGGSPVTGKLDVAEATRLGVLEQLLAALPRACHVTLISSAILLPDRPRTGAHLTPKARDIIALQARYEARLAELWNPERCSVVRLGTLRASLDRALSAVSRTLITKRLRPGPDLFIRIAPENWTSAVETCRPGVSEAAGAAEPFSPILDVGTGQPRPRLQVSPKRYAWIMERLGGTSAPLFSPDEV